MNFFNLFLANNNDKNKAKEAEMANAYEFGYNEIEQTKYNKNALERENFSTYEYYSEEE